MSKILIIEDQQDIRENAAEILELAGYQVLQAENGKVGLELAAAELPDLIICDIMMPVLDGYGVLHVLEKNPQTAAIPFIFLTAKSERSDLRKGMEMGADDYITKPFDDSELLRAVESRLRKKELLKKSYAAGVQGFMDFLKDIRSLDEAVLQLDEKRLKSYSAGEAIYSEGNRPHFLYLLKKGKVKIFNYHEYGKEFISEICMNGDFFGYVQLLEDKTYTDNAEAMEDSEVYLIPKDDFMDLLYKHPGVTEKFIQMLSKNIEEKEKNLVDLAYSSLRKRVANILVQLHEKALTQTGTTDLKISRDELAQLAGTATESLIRTLSDFKSEKLIESKGSTIKILLPEKLRNLRG
ncbi:MAG: response regulator [Bacteroidia bacterium]|nr:response regulator [Bacteroidia bacterium]